MSGGVRLTGSRRTSGARRRWWHPAILRTRSVWSAVWLGVVCFATVFWANVAFAQYPGGGRDPGNFYYCYASQSNPTNGTLTGVSWSPMTCEQLLFQEPAGMVGTGDYESVQMVGSVAVGGPPSGQAAKLRAFVMPPQGLKDFEFACTATTQACHLGGAGSIGATSLGTVGSSNFTANGTGWSVNAPSPTTNGTCTTGSINVVGHFSATAYDRFWTVDTPGTWTSAGASAGAYWDTQSIVASDTRSAASNFNCRIIGWEMWPAWVGDPWEPGFDDIVVPSPTPTVGATPSYTSPFPSITPVIPVSNTVEFDIGEPGEEVCTIIIPGYTYVGTIFGYDIDLEWLPYELCTQPVSFALQFMGLNIGAYLALAFGVMSLGVVFKLFSRSG